jgi:hypothetical protein
MTRRTRLVLVGLAVFGGAFGAGTAWATAQTSSTTPNSGTVTTPNNGSTPHTCPHHADGGASSSGGSGYSNY